jgi:hypothetical protein
MYYVKVSIIIGMASGTICEDNKYITTNNDPQNTVQITKIEQPKPYKN